MRPKPPPALGPRALRYLELGDTVRQARKAGARPEDLTEALQLLAALRASLSLVELAEVGRVMQARQKVKAED